MSGLVIPHTSPVLSLFGSTPTELEKVLRPESPNPTIEHAQLKEGLLDLFKTYAIQGSHTVVLYELTINDQKSLLLLFGEVHDNPDLCPNTVRSKDVVLDVVLDTLHKLEPSILILETFHHLQSKDAARMIEILTDMKRKGYPIHLLHKCTKQGDRGCIYTKPSGALMFLRMFTALVRYAASLETAQWAIDLSDRIYAMDPREDLGMVSPFNKRLTKEEVIRALENIKPMILHNFLLPIPDPAWEKRFQQVVLAPFLDKVEAAKSCTDDATCHDMYEELFLRIPDVVAVSQMLGVLAHSRNNNMPTPLVMSYSGQFHVDNQKEFMTAMSVFGMEKVLEMYPQSTSCARMRSAPS